MRIKKDGVLATTPEVADQAWNAAPLRPEEAIAREFTIRTLTVFSFVPSF